jgi:hypothetical protein
MRLENGKNSCMDGYQNDNLIEYAMKDAQVNTNAQKIEKMNHPVW